MPYSKLLYLNSFVISLGSLKATYQEVIMKKTSITRLSNSEIAQVSGGESPYLEINHEKLKIAVHGACAIATTGIFGIIVVSGLLFLAYETVNRSLLENLSNYFFAKGDQQ